MVAKLKLIRSDIKDPKTKLLLWKIVEHAYLSIIKSPEEKSLKFNEHKQELIDFIYSQLLKAKEEDYQLLIGKDPILSVKLASASLFYIGLPEDYCLILYKSPGIALPLKLGGGATIKSHSELKDDYSDLGIKCEVKEEWTIGDKKGYEEQKERKDKIQQIISNNVGAVCQQKDGKTEIAFNQVCVLIAKDLGRYFTDNNVSHNNNYAWHVVASNFERNIGKSSQDILLPKQLHNLDYFLQVKVEFKLPPKMTEQQISIVVFNHVRKPKSAIKSFKEGFTMSDWNPMTILKALFALNTIQKLIFVALLFMFFAPKFLCDDPKTLKEPIVEEFEIIDGQKVPKYVGFMDQMCKARTNFLFFIGMAMMSVSLLKGVAAKVKGNKQKIDLIKEKNKKEQ